MVHCETTRPIIVRELASRAKSHYIRKRFERTFPEWLLMGEIPELFMLAQGVDDERSDVWKAVAKAWAEEIDDHPDTAEEIRHGEHELIINESLEKVFNYTTRFADYEFWHPNYTEKSKVIHVSGEYMFLAPRAVGRSSVWTKLPTGINYKATEW